MDDRIARVSPARVLIVGNSVSLPPFKGASSYPEKLAALLRDSAVVESKISSGATVDEMEPDVVQAIRTDRPRVVILQVGINDCAPRPLARPGRDRLSRLRPLWLRQRVIGILHRLRPEIIRLRGVKQLTPIRDFERSVAAIIAAAVDLGTRVLVLPITRITREAERRTPFANQEIHRYNSVLQSFARPGVRVFREEELFPNELPEDYCADATTVHLSERAHDRIAAVLADDVRQALASGAVIG